MSVKQEKKKRSHLFTKDKQTIISRWRKERKEQIKHSSLKSAGSISQIIIIIIINNNNIYKGSPTRQGGFQWGPHAKI